MTGSVVCITRGGVQFPVAVFICLFFCFHRGYAQGVAKSPMRDLTAKELVYDMKVGWNLGNTLDATTGGETGWGNPRTTQAMMDAVKKMGFKTVRIPVTWQGHFGGAPDYTIERSWLDRVEEIANYVLRDSMYAIVNTHHDEWISLRTSDKSTVADRVAKLWGQIALRFRDYSDYLVFEIMNEPRQSVNEWTGGTPEARAIINEYHQAAVDAIRATGGNNGTRFIMCCTHAATPSDEAIAGLEIPDDNDPRIIVSIHTYYPNEFSFPENRNVTNWGSSEDRENMMQELDREQIAVRNKGGGTAVIGEWASAHKNNLSAREDHAEFYAREVRSRGMLPIWWDNGAQDFGILNRQTNPPSWTWPTIAEALVQGASEAVPVVRKQAAGVPERVVSGIRVQAGRLAYSLSESVPVSLRIYSLQGKLIATPVRSVQRAGDHTVAISHNGLSSGSFLFELKTGNRFNLKKSIILR
jgi:endoglucanase